ncbi:MAG: Smr/MutS family protein [Nitrospirae bacterium]|nr:Smr/MutS family protein [Nitrospirota bacterium]
MQDYLDLHGYTLEEAEIMAGEFIRDSVRRRLRCVKIIHGRGLRSPSGPVIKDALMRWLTGRRKYVKAFATARGCDGGLGAVYVLLK